LREGAPISYQPRPEATFPQMPDTLDGDNLLRRPLGTSRFRGGLVFKAHRLLYHSILGWRVIKKKKKGTFRSAPEPRGNHFNGFTDLYLKAKARIRP